MQKNWFVCGVSECIIGSYHLKTGSGNSFFGGILRVFGFWWGLLGSWVGDKPGMRMGWADPEKLVCMQILRMYNWILTKLSS